MVHRVVVEKAKRQRRCGHDRSHGIKAGDVCISIHEGMFKRKGYCRTCARLMIEFSRKQLNLLEGRLA